MKLFIAAILVAFAVSQNLLHDTITNPADLEYKAGQEYRYRFDSQIASGIAEISQQKALTRIQAEAILYFNSDQLVTLRLDNIRVGAADARVIQHADRVQPIENVEKQDIDPDYLAKLQLPVQFNYVDGLVERVNFDTTDDVWSKNIKRSVLNMLQVNLKAKNLPEDQKSEILVQDPGWKELTPRMFTATEPTIEGECDTTYVVNKLENMRSNDVDFFNVTKTIDFKQCSNFICSKMADVHYGPQQPQQRLFNRWQQPLNDERTIQRSTILRYFIVGTPEKFAMKRAEAISQYTFKTLNAEQETPMISVVVNELTCIGVNKNPGQVPTGPGKKQEESLLYSNEYDRDVKRFYMHGDEEFQDKTPFDKIQNKQVMVFNLIRKIQTATEDKQAGIEAEATVILPRLVELLRTCTVREIEEYISQAEGKTLEILHEALFLAATRNTIYVLVDRINKEQIAVPKAIQALKALSGSPAPSEMQVQILTRLCKSEASKKSESLRQSCWLTVGALIGELCETSQQNNLVINNKASSEMCPQHVSDKFVETFNDEYERSDTRYEKILVLKAVGNAGLKESLPQLRQIIYDKKLDPLVRAQAIDSLRRLRDQIPNELQAILMPIFKNQQEFTEIRLHALSLIMQTIPDNSLLDQIAFVLLRERSKNVKSFVNDIMISYSKSPVFEEKRLAHHLKAILKLAGVDENSQVKTGISHAAHVPIYSRGQNEGVFLNTESVFSSDNAFPKKVAIGLDSFFNGVLEKNSFEISVQQEDLERWYQKIVNAWLTDSYSIRSTIGDGDSELSKIFQNLDLKSRRDSQEALTGRPYIQPFGFLSARMRNIDYAILPLEDKSMPDSLRKLIAGEKPTIISLESIMNQLKGQNFQANSAWNFYERMSKIPTIAGIPLKLTLSVPALASVESNGNLRANGISLKTQPIVTISHVKKIEAWCPLVNSGVENVVSVEFNVPLDVDFAYDKSDKSVKITIDVPNAEHRLLGFHSLPVTFVRKFNSATRVHRKPQVNTIENELMEERYQKLDDVFGKKPFGLPIHVTGFIHSPYKRSYISTFNAWMTTENHVHVEFKPTDESPRQIQLRWNSEAFATSEDPLRPSFPNFYDKFDSRLEERYDFQESEANDEQSLGKILARYQSRRALKHSAKAEIRTVGGPKELKAKLELETVCDDRFGYCKSQVNFQRDPMFRGENRDWKFTSNMHTLVPDYSVDYQQFIEKKNEKNHKFLSAVDCQWGYNEEKYLKLRVNGEQAKTREWLDAEKSESEKKTIENRERNAFLNKFDISAEYNVDQQLKSSISRVFDYIKLVNFWNTKIYGVSSKRDGLVTALVVIDPISRQHYNVTINTPSEKVHIATIQTPVKIAPFPLIRHPSKSSKSAQQLFTNIVSKKGNNDECLIDGTHVRTFDDVTFKAPITNCYTVLAKDCNSESRFAVLMKKTDGENKKLKVVHKNGNIIEIEEDGGKFRVTINGDSVEEREWEDYGISKLDNILAVENRDITVRFDGRQTWVKISSFYKNNQCGICGHYDDDEENEFVKGNNERTSDIRQYYDSFTIKDGKCDADFHEITRKHDFETVDSDELTQDSRENGDEPIEKTKIMEYNHKICFSLKPVRECPRDRYPSVKSITVKVQFACLSRDSVQARRFLRKFKSANVIREVRDLAPTFVENIKIPTKCVDI